MEKKRLGIVGCGHLGNIVTDAICQGLLPEYELVGGAGRRTCQTYGRERRLSGLP